MTKHNSQERTAVFTASLTPHQLLQRIPVLWRCWPAAMHHVAGLLSNGGLLLNSSVLLEQVIPSAAAAAAAAAEVALLGSQAGKQVTVRQQH
jgi:hypothetical protein